MKTTSVAKQTAANRCHRESKDHPSQLMKHHSFLSLIIASVALLQAAQAYAGNDID